MITTAHRMESLSRAYLQAVAAKAGLSYSVGQYDYGVDIALKEVESVGGRYSEVGTQIDVQLKATTNFIGSETEIKFDLDVRAYDFLRVDRNFLRVLVVLLLPSDENEWLSQSADELAMRKCAYWAVLRGSGPTDSEFTTRIAIPRSQVLTPESLIELIRRPIPRSSP